MSAHRNTRLAGVGIVLALIVLSGAACSTQTPAAGTSFTNPNGQYSFVCPAAWKAAINQYNADNSLYGPDASGSSGLGGVEVFPNQTSIDAFLGGIGAQYTGTTNVTVDGVSGVRTQYAGSAVSGEQVVLLKGSILYNIYINSQKSEDVELFNQVVSTFKFTQ
jgi:hypothetical protein